MMAAAPTRIVAGDTINFDQLNATLQHAVDKEDRYYRENDAKFRAVAQKVQSYEEFEDIVKASHIKPMTEDVANLELKRSSWSTSGRCVA
jgi:ASC-1-like (ASCH) protein